MNITNLVLVPLAPVAHFVYLLQMRKSVLKAKIKKNTTVEYKDKSQYMSNDTYAQLSWPLTHIVMKAETILTFKVTMSLTFDSKIKMCHLLVMPNYM